MVEIPAVERQHRYCADLEAYSCEMLAWFPIVLAIVSQSMNDLVDKALGVLKKVC